MKGDTPERTSRVWILNFSWMAGVLGVVGFLLLGMISLWILPPFQVPDEPSHWWTAVQRKDRMLSSLGLKNYEACTIEQALPAFYRNPRLSDPSWKQGHQPRTRWINRIKPVCPPPIVTYGTLLTYPGVLISSLLVGDLTRQAPRALAVFYGARLFHGFLIALVFARVLVLARQGFTGISPLIAIIPLLLSPIFIQQSFAVSADVICHAALLYAIGAGLFARTFSKIDWAVLITLSLIASMTKPVFAVACGLVALMALIEQHHTAPTKWLLWANAAIAGLGAGNEFILALAPTSSVSEAPRSVMEQISYITSHPFDTLVTLQLAIEQYASLSLLLSHLGWFELRTSYPLRVAWFYLAASCLIFSVLSSPVDKGITLRIRTIQLAASIVVGYACVWLTALSMYLFWTPPGSDTVKGLQPRYFLPLYLIVLPWLCLFLGAVSAQLRLKVSERAVGAVQVACLGVAIWMWCKILVLLAIELLHAYR